MSSCIGLVWIRLLTHPRDHCPRHASSSTTTCSQGAAVSPQRNATASTLRGVCGAYRAAQRHRGTFPVTRRGRSR
jgi:hypothetical protein